MNSRELQKQEAFEAMEKEQYRIGELAKIIGITPRTLRYYEELNLIYSARTPGGQRLYGQRSLNRLNIIESLKIAGFSLQEIRHILLDWRESTERKEAAEKLLAILQAKHDEIAKTVAALSSLREQLETSISLLDNCISCTQQPEPDPCSSCEASREEGKSNPLIDEILKN